MGFSSLFSFLKPKAVAPPQPSSTMLGMVMLSENQPPDWKAITETLKTDWGIEIGEYSEKNVSVAFSVNGNLLAMGFMSVPIPFGDIESVADYNYYWPEALLECKKMQTHFIVTVMGDNGTAIDRVKLLTAAIASILTSMPSAFGVYLGSQTLLLKKEFYLEDVEELKTGKGIPLRLWVYFGFRQINGKSSVYTYGMEELGFHNMEVLDSHRSVDEIMGFIMGIADYVISSNVTFKNGETVGFTAEQKCKLTLSKGKYVDGDSFKIGF